MSNKKGKKIAINGGEGESGREILELLRQYRIKPNRLRGQNFLIDDAVYEQILTAAALNKNDIVLEIGAGFGTLTSRLAARAGRVIAVEVDSKLVSILRHRFAKTGNIEVVEQDILSLEVSALQLEKKYKI